MAGLRQRKKELVRTTIQKVALRLFSERGYEETTVEQIADAAGVSPASVYRYYRSKEDLVVTDEYDPIIIQSLLERPADEPLIESVRAMMLGVMAEYFERDRELLAARMALRRNNPALQVAFAEEQARTMDLFAALLARHLRRSPNDLDVRIACGALTGALQEAFGQWYGQGATGGEKRVREILNHAIDRVESALRF
jgi:AcrR family transcriptional regulator